MFCFQVLHTQRLNRQICFVLGSNIIKHRIVSGLVVCAFLCVDSCVCVCVCVCVCALLCMCALLHMLCYVCLPIPIPPHVPSCACPPVFVCVCVCPPARTMLCVPTNTHPPSRALLLALSLCPAVRALLCVCVCVLLHVPCYVSPPSRAPLPSFSRPESDDEIEDDCLQKVHPSPVHIPTGPNPNRSEAEIQMEHEAALAESVRTHKIEERRRRREQAVKDAAVQELPGSSSGSGSRNIHRCVVCVLTCVCVCVCVGGWVGVGVCVCVCVCVGWVGVNGITGRSCAGAGREQQEEWV